MDSREYLHRVGVRIHIRDQLVHIEEVAILGSDRLPSQSLDRLGEVKVNSLSRTDTIAGITALLSSTRGHITRYEVTKCRVATLEVVVTILLRDVEGGLRAISDRLCILLFLRYPYAPIVAERLRHKGQLGLVVALLGDTGRVDLYHTGVGEVCALLVAEPRCRAIAS